MNAVEAGAGDESGPRGKLPITIVRVRLWAATPHMHKARRGARAVAGALSPRPRRRPRRSVQNDAFKKQLRLALWCRWTCWSW